ncbi:hypothetical protein NESM_000296300 [Novymonas esmeraldas]|uniref:Uncharacterized protein n=1 Tax=Novymonas esmeraldas TaxID=1808958 RepID=A0AAW0F8Q3_9TRYP
MPRPSIVAASTSSAAAETAHDAATPPPLMPATTSTTTATEAAAAAAPVMELVHCTSSSAVAGEQDAHVGGGGVGGGSSPPLAQLPDTAGAAPSLHAASPRVRPASTTGVGGAVCTVAGHIRAPRARRPPPPHTNTAAGLPRRRNTHASVPTTTPRSPTAQDAYDVYQHKVKARAASVTALVARVKDVVASSPAEEERKRGKLLQRNGGGIVHDAETTGEAARTARPVRSPSTAEEETATATTSEPQVALSHTHAPTRLVRGTASPTLEGKYFASIHAPRVGDGEHAPLHTTTAATAAAASPPSPHREVAQCRCERQQPLQPQAAALEDRGDGDVDGDAALLHSTSHTPNHASVSAAVSPLNCTPAAALSLPLLGFVSRGSTPVLSSSATPTPAPAPPPPPPQPRPRQQLSSRSASSLYRDPRGKGGGVVSTSASTVMSSSPMLERLRLRTPPHQRQLSAVAAPSPRAARETGGVETRRRHVGDSGGSAFQFAPPPSTWLSCASEALLLHSSPTAATSASTANTPNSAMNAADTPATDRGDAPPPPRWHSPPPCPRSDATTTTTAAAAAAATAGPVRAGRRLWHERTVSSVSALSGSGEPLWTTPHRASAAGLSAAAAWGLHGRSPSTHTTTQPCPAARTSASVSGGPHALSTATSVSSMGAFVLSSAGTTLVLRNGVLHHVAECVPPPPPATTAATATVNGRGGSCSPGLARRVDASVGLSEADYVVCGGGGGVDGHAARARLPPGTAIEAAVAAGTYTRRPSRVPHHARDAAGAVWHTDTWSGSGESEVALSCAASFTASSTSASATYASSSFGSVPRSSTPTLADTAPPPAPQSHGVVPGSCNSGGGGRACALYTAAPHRFQCYGVADTSATAAAAAAAAGPRVRRHHRYVRVHHRRGRRRSASDQHGAAATPAAVGVDSPRLSTSSLLYYEDVDSDVVDDVYYQIEKRLFPIAAADHHHHRHHHQHRRPCASTTGGGEADTPRARRTSPIDSIFTVLDVPLHHRYRGGFHLSDYYAPCPVCHPAMRAAAARQAEAAARGRRGAGVRTRRREGRSSSSACSGTETVSSDADDEEEDEGTSSGRSVLSSVVSATAMMFGFASGLPRTATSPQPPPLPRYTPVTATPPAAAAAAPRLSNVSAFSETPPPQPARRRSASPPPPPPPPLTSAAAAHGVHASLSSSAVARAGNHGGGGGGGSAAAPTTTTSSPLARGGRVWPVPLTEDAATHHIHYRRWRARHTPAAVAARRLIHTQQHHRGAKDGGLPYSSLMRQHLLCVRVQNTITYIDPKRATGAARLLADAALLAEATRRRAEERTRRRGAASKAALNDARTPTSSPTTPVAHHRHHHHRHHRRHRPRHGGTAAAVLETAWHGGDAEHRAHVSSESSEPLHIAQTAMYRTTTAGDGVEQPPMPPAERWGSGHNDASAFTAAVRAAASALHTVDVPACGGTHYVTEHDQQQQHQQPYTSPLSIGLEPSPDAVLDSAATPPGLLHAAPLISGDAAEQWTVRPSTTRMVAMHHSPVARVAASKASSESLRHYASDGTRSISGSHVVVSRVLSRVDSRSGSASNAVSRAPAVSLLAATQDVANASDDDCVSDLLHSQQHMHHRHGRYDERGSHSRRSTNPSMPSSPARPLHVSVTTSGVATTPAHALPAAVDVDILGTAMLEYPLLSHPTEPRRR